MQDNNIEFTEGDEDIDSCITSISEHEIKNGTIIIVDAKPGTPNKECHQKQQG
jgi:hypothetical protein